MRLNPKVSIIIPVYNGSNFMRDAIESVLAQTYQNIEIIVVNDGSCDEGRTESIAQSYGNSIRYVAKENGGVATALNLGIRLAQGDFISWLSHDDLYLPNKIKLQVALMRRQTSERVIIYSDHEALDVCSSKLYDCKISHLSQNLYLQDMILLLFRSALHGCTFLIPRSCFDDVGYFNEKLQTTQDYDLWFKMLKQGYEFVHLPQILVRARLHQEQGTLSMRVVHHREVENLYIWAFDQFSKNIITFQLDHIIELILLLKSRTLKAAPEHILTSIKQFNSKLYYSLKIKLISKIIAINIRKVAFKALCLTVNIIPKSVKSLINRAIDRFVFFIKIGNARQDSRTILFVALPESLHTARWINQFTEQGWDLHLFPAIDAGKVHPELNNVTIYYSFFGNMGIKHTAGNQYRGIYLPTRIGTFLALRARFVLQQLYPSYRVHQLSRLIRRLSPDVVHSLEFQNAGYLTLAARETLGKAFPKWIATNWGNDIYLYGKLPRHLPIIRRLLECCDFYSCECNRDAVLAREYGFKGEVLPVFPNAGGYDLKLAKTLQSPGQVSERRLIMLKGYGLERGRAVSALRALERCENLLKEKNYQIVVYLATDDVILAAELFASTTDIQVSIFPFSTDHSHQHYALSHSEILKLHGQARISINNNIADGIAISLLDAMVMGSFPIHSCGACGNEWFENGITGLIVPPNDPEEIEAAIRKALTDDDLVNQAADFNWKTACERLEYTTLKELSMQFYSRVFSAN